MLTVGAWWRCGGARYSPGLLLGVSRDWLVRLLSVVYGTSLLAADSLTIRGVVLAENGSNFEPEQGGRFGGRPFATSSHKERPRACGAFVVLPEQDRIRTRSVR